MYPQKSGGQVTARMHFEVEHLWLGATKVACGALSETLTI